MKISVIIPVLNESDRINQLVSHVDQIFSGCGYEIIVSDGDESGSTIRAIRNESVIKIKSVKGRAAQMNNGALSASGDILLFLHADTMLPPDAFIELENAFLDDKISAGAFDLSFDLNSFGMNFISFVARRRSRITRIPFGDQAIFIRKKYFESLGGFSKIPLMEDVDLIKRIRKKGDRIYISKKRVITSSRKWQTEGVVLTTLRNWCFQFLFAIGVSPDNFAQYYFRRKK